MNEILVNYYLFIGLVFLILVWRFTSNYSLKSWLIRLPTAGGMVSFGFEIIMFFQLANFIYLPFPISPWPILFTALGLFLFTIGIALATWAKFTMKANWGVPAQHNIKKQQALVTQGPFNYTRNPIYLGLMLTFLGFQLTLGSLLLLLTIPLYLFVIIAIRKEEKLLENYFGDQYQGFKTRTPRFF